jgi:hypothetical protein
MAGELVQHVVAAIAKKGPAPGYNRDLRTWPEAAIQLAVQETRAFEQAAREKHQRQEAGARRLEANSGAKSS